MDSNSVNNLCRLCAENLEPNLAQNSESENNSNRKSVLSLINKYLKIKISDNQSLPQKFCAECIRKLQSFDSFSRRCHEVQEMFNNASAFQASTKEHRYFSQDYEFSDKLNSSSSESQECKKSMKSDESDGDLADEGTNDVGSDYIDDIPLAQRVKTRTRNSISHYAPPKRGRPRKNALKVPPLRIKAVKSKKLPQADYDTPVNEGSNTQYEIHENNKTEFPDKKGEAEIKEDQKILDNDDDDDGDFDDGNFSDDSFVYNDTRDSQKTIKKNPFALFEFKCHICSEVFKNFSILKRHCKKEHGTSAFVNCVCGKQLRARTAIIEHRRKHTGTSLYKCDTCSKTFNRRSLMCLHMISHMPKDEQPYVCCKCAKRFHTSSLLKKHEKVHLPEEERFLDVCNICQKKFTSKSAVNAHLRAVHYGEKPFVCEHCGNSFSSKAILTDHLTTHSSYAPWPCNVCGRNFKSKYRLNVHMDMHRSVKYRCPHCPMELSTRRTLRMHLLVHKEEKAYVCKVCSKAFRRSKDLKNHSNLHTGRRPYKCEFCERTFANGSNCRAHKLRMHPEELGVEKNCRSLSKQPKITNNVNMVTTAAVTAAAATISEANKVKNLTMLPDVVKNPPTVADYMKYENKYEFPTSSQELDYSLDYARYSTPLNLNMKKPVFMQQPNINHLTGFTTDMHPDVSKMHFLYS